MTLAGFSFNWFDFAVVIVIAVGVFRGKSRGMSEELLDVFKWLLIVLVGGLAYRPVGQMLAGFTSLSLLTSYLMVYFMVIVVIRLLFGWVKRMVGEKLVGSDVFGSWEYYLGMVAGAVRFSCYLIVAMAVLNAKYISPDQLAAQARLQQENFGDISFPTIGSLQQTVFVGSASGQFVKKYLGQELIVTTAADKKSSGETLGRQRERAVYEVLGEKR